MDNIESLPLREAIATVCGVIDNAQHIRVRDKADFDQAAKFEKAMKVLRKARDDGSWVVYCP